MDFKNDLRVDIKQEFNCFKTEINQKLQSVIEDVRKHGTRLTEAEQWVDETETANTELRDALLHTLKQQRLLYLFMLLRVKVPTSQFKDWDKQISRFIWQGRKPRNKYSTLIISKERGGMSLPNLRDYYYSAQLKTIVLWCDNKYEVK